MNKCVECGKKNKNHAEFCKECGAELPKKLSKEEKSQIRFEKCKEKYGHLLTISKACIFLSIVALGYFVYTILRYSDPVWTVFSEMNPEKLHVIVSFAVYFIIVLTGLVSLGIFIKRADKKMSYLQIGTNTVVPFLASFIPIGGVLLPGFMAFSHFKNSSWMSSFYTWDGDDPLTTVAVNSFQFTEAVNIGNVSKLILTYMIISMSFQVLVYADHQYGNSIVLRFNSNNTTSGSSWDGQGNFNKDSDKHIIRDKTIRGAVINLRGTSELKIINCVLDSCTIYSSKHAQLSITGSSVKNSKVKCIENSINTFDRLTIGNSSFIILDESQNAIGNIVAETTSFEFKGKSRTRIDSLKAKKSQHQGEVISFRDDCEVTIAHLQVENNIQTLVLYNQANVHIIDADITTTESSPGAIIMRGSSKLNIDNGSIEAKKAIKTISKYQDATFDLGNVQTR